MNFQEIDIPASKLISPRRIVDALRRRAGDTIHSANFALGLLKENRADWLSATGLIDQYRNDLRLAAVVLSDLVDPDEYIEIQNILADALLKIDQIGNEATTKYLLNGPKAVSA